MNKTYYEYLILTKHQNCDIDITRLRKKYCFKPFKDRDVALAWTIETDNKNNEKKQSLYSKIRNDSQKIIAKYQPKNANSDRFVDMFTWYVLTDQEVFTFESPIRIKYPIPDKPKENEHVFLYIKRGLTKSHYMAAWPLIKNALNELPKNDYMRSQRNAKADFDNRLKIYKCYLRAKKQWGDNIYNRLYDSDEMYYLLKKLNQKDLLNRESMIKIIERFGKEFPDIEIISDKELKKPVMEEDNLLAK